MSKQKKIELFFDVISPYAFLAFNQVKNWPEEKGIEIEFKPLLLAALLSHHGTKGPAEIVKKREYTFKDVWRWARFYNIEIAGPPVHPFNPLAPLRTIIACPAGQRLKCVDVIMSACWQGGVDVSKYENIVQVLNENGLDGAALRQQAASRETKDQLKANTDEAIQLGIFGVPTFKVADQIFWGNDRLHFVERAIEGDDFGINEAEMKKVMARPGISRRV